MARNARATALKVPRKRLLPPDWRDDGRWKITAMLAKISQYDYLSEARAFENHHICHQTMSEDWHAMWHEWCVGKLTGHPVVAEPVEVTPKRSRLFA